MGKSLAIFVDYSNKNVYFSGKVAVARLVLDI